MTDERGGRYFREARFFLAGDKVAAQSHILEARSLMGYMRDMHALGGPPIQVQYTTLQDGTQIKATMMNGQYQAQIFTPFKSGGEVSDVYEIWVRPDWSEVVFNDEGPYNSDAYDWYVLPKDDCDGTTIHNIPHVYSNRMWHAPDKSVYCVVGGRDRDKYTGAAGTNISKDGKIVYTGTGIVGCAVFQGQLVVVLQDLNTVTISGIIRDQVRYTVLVGGTVTLITDIIDAYTDSGYARGLDETSTHVVDFGFSQNIIVFNSDGSEGSAVLGNSKRIKIT